MGKKFIVEEVEEKSELGCGGILVLIIFGFIAAITGGFKSCKQDKGPKAIESRTEQPQRSDEVKVRLPPYNPTNSYSDSSAPTSTTNQELQEETDVESATEITFDDDIETEEPLVFITPTGQEDSIIAETDSEAPALTKKEHRKAERQAKREARRREKAQKNN